MNGKAHMLESQQLSTLFYSCKFEAWRKKLDTSFPRSPALPDPLASISATSKTGMNEDRCGNPPFFYLIKESRRPSGSEGEPRLLGVHPSITTCWWLALGWHLFISISLSVKWENNNGACLPGFLWLLSELTSVTNLVHSNQAG